MYSIFLTTVITTLAFGANGYEEAQRTLLQQKYLGKEAKAAIEVLRSDQAKAVSFFLQQLAIHSQECIQGDIISDKLTALVLGNERFGIPPIQWSPQAAQQLKSGLVKNLKDKSLALRAESCLHLGYQQFDLYPGTEDLIAQTARKAIESEDENLRMVGYLIARSTGPRLVPFLLEQLKIADALSDEDKQLLYFCLRDAGPFPQETIPILQARKEVDNHPALIGAMDEAIAAISEEEVEPKDKEKETK